MSSSSGKIILLYGDTALTRLALFGITRLALERRIIWVLDGANSFDAYFIARLARGLGCAPAEILARVRLSRAFTCYQMSELAMHKLAQSIAAESAAILCLGLIETFFDEDIRVGEAVRLLELTLAALADLARRGHTIIITAREPSIGERAMLFEMLKAAAQVVRHIHAPIEPARLPMQRSLM